MCRFMFYMGPSISMDLLIVQPAHSIIRQSYKCEMRVEPLNGDGFGVAWYTKEMSQNPALFRSTQPAWNNKNFLNISAVISSPVVLSHVRAATEGLSISQENCHPFKSGHLAFMHNGSVSPFNPVKRKMQQLMSDEVYLTIEGSTDSEHLFALFQEYLNVRANPHYTLKDMAHALIKVIQTSSQLSRECGGMVELNSVVTDGEKAVISRYASDGNPPPSLFYKTCGEIVLEKGEVELRDQEKQGVVWVASEPLTRQTDWSEIPGNHLMLIHPNKQVEFMPIVVS